MKVTLVDDAGWTIGNADLSKIRMRESGVKRQEPKELPLRHYEPWGEFEEGHLETVFRNFISDQAMKQGRTEGAIMSRLRRFMPGTWS